MSPTVIQCKTVATASRNGKHSPAKNANSKEINDKAKTNGKANGKATANVTASSNGKANGKAARKRWIPAIVRDDLTDAGAANLKNVTTAIVDLAGWKGRIPHTRILDKIALKVRDMEKWTPIRSRGRAGAKGRRPRGLAMTVGLTRISQCTKAPMDQAQGPGAKAKLRPIGNHSKKQKDPHDEAIVRVDACVVNACG
jgi:hypothetical protein